MMKFYKFISIISCCIAIIMTGCSKTPVNTTGTDTGNEDNAPLGTYLFDGKEYPIKSAVYVDDNRQILIRISPLEMTEDQVTYIVLGINASLEGQEVDVDRMYHNDDYYFRYEDPLYYYSEFRKLKSGTMKIQRGLEEGVYNIEADILLPDGKAFKLSLAELKPDPQTVN